MTHSPVSFEALAEGHCPPPPQPVMLRSSAANPSSVPHTATAAATRGDEELARGLKAIFDQFELPLLLVGPAMQLLYSNRAAWTQIDEQHPLHISGPRLYLRHAPDVAPWMQALADAFRGQRRLLTLGAGTQPVLVSLIPLSSPDGATRPIQPLGVLVVPGQLPQDMGTAAARLARAVPFTPTETRVLQALCAGQRPAEIAQALGIAISTVRTHVASLRSKTGAPSIRDLVRQVAALPPLSTLPAAKGEAARPQPSPGAA